MAFIDREQELAELRKLASAPPSLIIVRGRRRVGKSFLVREALAGMRVASYQADEQTEAEQLDGFSRELGRLVPGSPALGFARWDDALEFVAALAAQAPVVVVLDEFQYLCRSRPALPSIIQRHWDRWDADRIAVSLVLVGSALSFMEGLLDSGAPLYGRARFRPMLEPFDYKISAAFAPRGWAADTLIERFAVLGGTPQYQAWAGGRRPLEAIQELMLTPGGPLYDEPLQLLRSEDEIRDTARYFGALVAIAAGRNRTGEVAASIGWDSSNTSKVLDRLQRLGYIALVEPISPSGSRARAIWQISDPYLTFWFRRVFPNRSRIAIGKVDEVRREVEADLDGYLGQAFERCCLDWFARYAPIPEANKTVRFGRWWSRDGQHEIDVAGMDRRGRYTFLGSCKWHRGRVGRGVLDQLRRVRDELGGPAAGAKLGVFARRGFSTSLEDAAARDGVLLVTAADLF